MRAGRVLAIVGAAAAVLAGGEALGPSLDGGEPPRPGAEAPAAAAAACVVEFDWDENYRSVIVVGDGAGMVKPAWVATYEREPARFIVGYRATAFRDARGRLHIDARRSTDVGPMASSWSPDSFAFGERLMWVVDDAGRGQSTAMGTVKPAAEDPAGWRAAMLRLQALIEGGL